MASWYHLLLILGALFWWGFQIKGAIDSAITVATEAMHQSQENDKHLREMEMDLKIFHQKYEDDMDRYIRENPKH